jgi:hypothetical protein
MLVIDLETVPGIPLDLAAQMSGDEDPAKYASLTPASS